MAKTLKERENIGVADEKDWPITTFGSRVKSSDGEVIICGWQVTFSRSQVKNSGRPVVSSVSQIVTSHAQVTGFKGQVTIFPVRN
jgi:hypothetical protein